MPEPGEMVNVAPFIITGVGAGEDPELPTRVCVVLTMERADDGRVACIALSAGDARFLHGSLGRTLARLDALRQSN